MRKNENGEPAREAVAPTPEGGQSGTRLRAFRSARAPRPRRTPCRNGGRADTPGAGDALARSCRASSRLPGRHWCRPLRWPLRPRESSSSSSPSPDHDAESPQGVLEQGNCASISSHTLTALVARPHLVAERLDHVSVATPMWVTPPSSKPSTLHRTPRGGYVVLGLALLLLVLRLLLVGLLDARLGAVVVTEQLVVRRASGPSWPVRI